MGVHISAMVHGASSCWVSGCVMYKLVAMEELLSSLTQLYSSQGEHCGSSSGFPSLVAKIEMYLWYLLVLWEHSVGRVVEAL